MRSEIDEFIAERIDAEGTPPLADARALADMVASGLVMRGNLRCYGAEWGADDLTVTVVLSDDGAPYGTIVAHGGTPWLAAASLALLTGYWWPADD